MFKNILLFILFFKNILSLKTNELKYIKLLFNDDYFIPTINIYIKDIKIETILDNNLHFNYISTKNFNLRDIKIHYNSDTITIKNKIYKANFYIGDISINDEKNIFLLNNFNAFIIDDRSILSSITISYILQALKEKSLINKKIFYLDINNKQCIFGELPQQDNEEYFKLNHSIFYSKDTKGIFKAKLNSLYIGNNYLTIGKNVSFNINEKNTFIPYMRMEEIIKDNQISNLDCKLILLEPNGKYGIKCHKNDINKLPNIFFVFKNYTFKIPFKLLFEVYDSNYFISLICNKIKMQNIENENIYEEKNEEEWIIGYSIIKLFNYAIFNYEERSLIFYSDNLITQGPPKIKNNYVIYIIYLFSFILGVSSIFLLFIRIRINSIPLESNN